MGWGRREQPDTLHVYSSWSVRKKSTVCGRFAMSYMRPPTQPPTHPADSPHLGHGCSRRIAGNWLHGSIFLHHTPVRIGVCSASARARTIATTQSSDRERLDRGPWSCPFRPKTAGSGTWSHQHTRSHQHNLKRQTPSSTLHLTGNPAPSLCDHVQWPRVGAPTTPSARESGGMRLFRSHASLLGLGETVTVLPRVRVLGLAPFLQPCPPPSPASWRSRCLHCSRPRLKAHAAEMVGRAVSVAASPGRIPLAPWLLQGGSTPP